MPCTIPVGPETRFDINREAGRSNSEALNSKLMSAAMGKGRVKTIDQMPDTDWVLANLWTARALALEGTQQQSQQRYDEFLRLWANADADLPALREARVERARLNRAIH